LDVNKSGKIQIMTSEPNERTQLNKPTNMERRSNQDRRQNSIPFYKLLLYVGKRQTLRRVDDCKRIVELDQYHPILLISILIVLGLSLLDAVLTLVLLDKGAVELNSVMRYYINRGSGTFVLVKYGITALALIIIVCLNAIISVRWRTASYFMFPTCALVFGSVVIWELYLLAK